MTSTERFSLAGKTAVVTGAAGLIGGAHCQALAEAGATVIAADLDQAAVDKTAYAINENTMALANETIGIVADVTQRESILALRDAVIERTGRIDILVNNAAINDMFENPSAALQLSRFENYPLDLWQRSLEVNVTGVFLCSQVLGTVMADHGAGSIINIASTYGIVAPDQSLYLDQHGQRQFYKSAVYPTSKGAVIAFTRFLAAYWGKAGVRVNTLSPGGVENGQDDFFVSEYARRTPLGRMAKTDDYAGALIFLASDASSYMSGANLVIDGGYTCW